MFGSKDLLVGTIISVRKPEATSIHRITAFNKTEVHRFYQLLEEMMAKSKFQPKNINCDETGISTVQEPGKVLAAKGQKSYKLGKRKKYNSSLCNERCWRIHSANVYSHGKE